jgi:arylformamidase
MEIIDVSIPIRERMIVYQGDPEPRIEHVQRISEGDEANVTRIELGAHTGTHVDAPVHFIDGAEGVETLPLEALVGEAEVVDATALDGDLDAGALRGLGLPDAERLLFRTRNSDLWERESFSPDFVGITPDGADVLRERGVRLVGVDYLSVGGPEAHRRLLGAGIVVVEGLDLRRVEPGGYRLLCLPLLLDGSDGAPARVVLLR